MILRQLINVPRQFALAAGSAVCVARLFAVWVAVDDGDNFALQAGFVIVNRIQYKMLVRLIANVAARLIMLLG